MLPSIEQKLMTNTSFKQLVLSALSSCIKTNLDNLTVTKPKPDTVAERKLLNYCRDKMRRGSVMNHNSSIVMASDTHVIGVLSMFDDTATDDIVYTVDEQGSIIIDWDQSKPILVDKITSSGYLFGLAEADLEDFSTPDE